MIEIAWNWGIICFKFSQSFFHSMIRSRLPYKFYFIWIISFRRRDIRKQFQTYLLVSSNFNNNSFRTPVIFIGYFQLVPRKQTCIIIFSTSKHKISISLFTLWANIKSNFHIVLGLTLFNFSVSLCLLWNQSLKYWFVLFAILIF